MLQIVDDRCAIKIQSLWRGYQLRKQLSKQIVQDKETYKHLVGYVGALRHSLKELMADHQRLMTVHKDECVKMKKALETLAKRTQSEETLEKERDYQATSLKQSELITENRVLKEKICLLEDRYASLELRFNAMEKAAASANASDTTLGTKLVEKTMDETCNTTGPLPLEPKVEVCWGSVGYGAFF